MGTTDRQASSTIEWIVLGLVVSAIFSIGVEPPPNSSPVLEVTHLSGTMNLSTQSSLDAFGLGEEARYAPAEIEVDSRGVVSEGCTYCSTSPTGVHMNGSILIPNLTGDVSRIEIEFNFTHLSETATDGFIHREWLTLNWGAGSLSGHWEFLIVHDPPRWSPDDRTRAAFIPSDGGTESRTGPWIFIETLLDHSLNAQGCLPDSSRCRGFPSRDVILTATRAPVAPPSIIPHPDDWVQLEGSPSTSETPTKMEGIREFMDLGEQINSTLWCHSSESEVISSQSWVAFNSGGVVIAPMSTWLEALTLPGSTFTPSEGTWSEVDTNQHGCASLTDENGILRLGVSVR